jgi:hypothetical protein
VIDSYNADRTGWARFSDDMTKRYRLARSLTHSELEVVDNAVVAERRVVFLMLNPSTADAFVLDPTIKRCRSFALAWGADVLEVVNLYAVRSTDPRKLREPGVDLGIDEIADEEIWFACRDADLVIAAWGNHGWIEARGNIVRDRLASAGIQLHHLGLTKEDRPKHPLYLKATTELEVWG